MNLIKIMLLVKRKFSEFYDVKRYKRQSSEQLIVRKYAMSNEKIMLDSQK